MNFNLLHCVILLAYYELQSGPPFNNVPRRYIPLLAIGKQ